MIIRIYPIYILTLIIFVTLILDMCIMGFKKQS